MMHEARLLKAIADSAVRTIALVDDAFNPPTFSSVDTGALMDAFENGSVKQACERAGLREDEFVAAREAVERGETDADSFLTLVGTLYGCYLEDLDARFDPAGLFSAAKGSNLAVLKPLLSLLAKCPDTIKIVRVGSRPEEIEKVDSKTDLIFLDYFLDEEVGPTSPTDSAQADAARRRSLDHVRTILADQPSGEGPSVILMSSHKVRARADTFRAEIGLHENGDVEPKVFSSRFCFIDKEQFTSTPDGVEVDPEAADALYDVFQSYEFGRAVHAALDCWLSSARSALDDVKSEIAKLEVKDFAYLLRFRLAPEGQSLLEYLEWFFNETLGDAIGRRLDANTPKLKRLAELDGEAASRVEGAFDGATSNVAHLYHRVRIEAPRPGHRINHRMGDLYVRDEDPKRSMLAVITPDCDLVKRKAGIRAPRILSVEGALHPFDAPDTSAADFVMTSDGAHNVVWNAKAVSSYEFDKWPPPSSSGHGLTFIGTLRPLYAQELQRAVLNDLGRIGLSVAPVFGLPAAVKVLVRKPGGKTRVLDVASGKSASCTVLPGRGGSDKSRVLFHRSFVTSLVSAIAQLRASDVDGVNDKIRNLEKPRSAEKLLAELVTEGVELETDLGNGLLVTAKPRPTASAEGPWCFLVVSMAALQNPVGERSVFAIPSTEEQALAKE